MSWSSSDLSAADNGSSVLETALLLPVLCLMLVGATDFGRAYYLSLEVASAVHAGALYGTQEPHDTSGMVSAAALDAADIPNLKPAASYGCECSDGSSVVVSCGTAPSCAYNVVNYVSVTASTTYKLLLPYPGFPSTLTLSAASKMRSSH